MRPYGGIRHRIVNDAACQRHEAAPFRVRYGKRRYAFSSSRCLRARSREGCIFISMNSLIAMSRWRMAWARSAGVGWGRGRADLAPTTPASAAVFPVGAGLSCPSGSSCPVPLRPQPQRYAFSSSLCFKARSNDGCIFMSLNSLIAMSRWRMASPRSAAVGWGRGREDLAPTRCASADVLPVGAGFSCPVPAPPSCILPPSRGKGGLAPNPSSARSRWAL